jgi:hypothetical protein
MKNKYMKKHEIYSAIDQLRTKNINEVDPIILGHLLEYLDNNAETIASLYEDNRDEYNEETENRDDDLWHDQWESHEFGSN